jgi:enamine deaminase RidA (YjgF/YER057c/UK114 family)
MSERITVSSGSTFEEQFGYSRAVRKGNVVKVSGTAPLRDGEVVAPGDPYEQTKYILEVIEDALHEADASIDDVVQSRVYVTDFSDWEEIGRAHREVFGDVKPANTMVEISGLPKEELLLEIEVEAVVA